MADAPRLSDWERDELVAYLDGEIEPAAAEEVRDRLARDERARGEAQSLSRAWDMLDFLDMPAARKEFTAQTVQSIAQLPAASEPKRKSNRRLAAALWAFGIVAAFFVGRYAVSAIPDPDRRLTHELSLWENLEEYEAVGDVDFLRLLGDKKLFDRNDNSPSGYDGAPPTPDDASRLKNLSMKELESLRRRREQFERMPSPDQERLRRLDAAATVGAGAPAVRRTLRDYMVWLDGLTPSQRKRIAEAADSTAKLAVVETLASEQKKNLETALRPMRENNSGRIPYAGRGGRSRWNDQATAIRERMTELEQKLRPELSPSELATLGKLADSRDRMPFLLILAATHQKPLTEPALQWQVYFFSKTYSAIEPIHRVFDSPEYSSLDSKQKEQFQEFLSATFIAAQSIDRETLLNFFNERKLPTPKKGQRLGIQPDSPLFYVIPCYYYFQSDLSRAPEDYRRRFMKFLKPDGVGPGRNRPERSSFDRPFQKMQKLKQDRPLQNG